MFLSKIFYNLATVLIKTRIMTIFKQMYWSTQSTDELRKAVFNTDLLDAYRNDARNELIRRTTDYKINDV